MPKLKQDDIPGYLRRRWRKRNRERGWEGESERNQETSTFDSGPSAFISDTEEALESDHGGGDADRAFDSGDSYEVGQDAGAFEDDHDEEMADIWCAAALAIVEQMGLTEAQAPLLEAWTELVYGEYSKPESNVCLVPRVTVRGVLRYKKKLLERHDIESVEVCASCNTPYQSKISSVCQQDACQLKDQKAPSSGPDAPVCSSRASIRKSLEVMLKRLSFQLTRDRESLLRARTDDRCDTRTFDSCINSIAAATPGIFKVRVGFATDGVTADGLLRGEIWPCYALLMDLPYVERNRVSNILFCGCASVGSAKIPRSTLEWVLEPLLHMVRESSAAAANGTPWSVIAKDGSVFRFEVVLSDLYVDLPALQALYPFKGYRHTCHLCTTTGNVIAGVRRFGVDDPAATVRTDDSCRKDAVAETNGFTATSDLLELLPLNRTGFDYLHIVLLGIFRNVIRE